MKPPDPPIFDPDKFIRAHPNDQRLQDAIKQISELASSTAPPQPDETALDARRRIEQGFNQLDIKLASDLEKADEDQRVGFKALFMDMEEAAINARYQKGIDTTGNFDLKVGGQIEREVELQKFRKEIDSNPELEKRMQGLVEHQAARQDAVFQTLNSACQTLLKQHSLDLVEAPPLAPTDNIEVLKSAPMQSEDFKTALEREKAAIIAHEMNEQLFPEMRKFNAGR